MAKKLGETFTRLLNEIYFRIGCMEGYLGLPVRELSTSEEPAAEE